ncbi:MAG: GNAT family N-acetyltransferase [Rhizobiaceae bacterium]|nr:GNAT family N-acetyltransferase [Rhizobiaceae bacterium]
MQPEIRVLDLAEIETLLDWAAAEGWNPGLGDAVPFLAADPAGFFGCYVEGTMVSGISAIAYSDGFGFVGLYITRKDMRGKGYGRLVWERAMAYLGGRTIGLDGVPEQQPNYARMGFAADYGTARWSGVIDAAHCAGHAETRKACDTDLDRIAAFDAAFFPAPRKAFLGAWLAAATSARLIEKDGEIFGYGAARQCRDGSKIGPLFAKTPQAAKALLAGLVADIGSERVDIDVPLIQLGFIAWLEAAGLVRGFETARMYRGTTPALHIAGVFAVTSLELG